MFDFDRATDEQKQVLIEKDKNILVSAAAGSGKTTVMIEKIVRAIVKENISIENFLIITFTKASAEDMKNKLINRLSYEPMSPFILSQMDLLPISDVSNLHSFCARLLKSYFYVVGLDPTFTVIDDLEQRKLKTRALDKLFDNESKMGSENFYDLADIFSSNRQDGKLREQILKLYEFSKSIYGFDEWFSENIKATYTDDFSQNKCAKIIINYARNIVYLFTQEISELKELISRDVINDEDKKKLIIYLDSIDSMLLSIRYDNTLELLAESVKSLGKFKSKPEMIEEDDKLYLDKCVELKTDIKSRLDTIKNSIFASKEDTIETVKYALQKTQKHVLGLHDLFKKFEEIYSGLKKDLGVLDFNDLEGYALKVLEDSETLKAIKEKYKYIFVDEYQDINSCQEKIISLISSDNNRFMVGDIKQSIYGFRLCDPEIFLDKFNKYKVDGVNSVSISLNKNFRSHADILEFVNIVFDNTMTKSFGGVDYAGTARLVAGKKRNEKDELKRAAILYINTTTAKAAEDVESKNLPVYSVKEHVNEETDETKKAYMEGMVIANKISEIITSNYMIVDKETQKLRHISYKDIVLLVQSRNPYLNDLLDVLDAHSIPISSDITSDVFEDDDILALKNMLLIISNIKQDKPLFSLMYSRLFGFSPDELATIRKMSDVKYFYEAVLSYPCDNSDLYYKVLAFIERINTYKKLSGFLMVKDLCYRIIKDFNIENYCLASSNYSERIAKLNKFLASLANVCLDEFLLNYDLDNISCECKTSSDSVRVMTIHKSKGLEFPVVFLIGTGNKFNMRSVTGDIVISKELGVCMNNFVKEERYKETTLARSASKIIENKKFYEEEQRLLYVALTRAIDFLFITGCASNKQLKENFSSTPTMFMDWFAPIILSESSDDYFDVEEYDISDFDSFSKEENDKNILVGAGDKSEVQKIKESLDMIYPYEKYTTMPQKTSVTKIVKAEGDDVIYKNTKSSSLSSADRGTVYHKIFQSLTLLEKDCESVQKAINKLTESRLLSKEQAQLVDAEEILKCLSINEFKELINNADWIKKESEFYMLLGDSSCNKDKVEVQGIIDLILSVNGEIVLIDYKTGRLNKESAKQKYQKQLELYRLAIEKIYGKKVSKMGIVAVDMQELYFI